MGNISEDVQSIPTSWDSWHVMYATQSVTLTQSLTRTLTKPYEKRFLETKWETPIQRSFNLIMQLSWTCKSNDSPFPGKEKGSRHRQSAMRTAWVNVLWSLRQSKDKFEFLLRTLLSCLSVVNSRNYADNYLRKMNYGQSPPPPLEIRALFCSYVMSVH